MAAPQNSAAPTPSGANSVDATLVALFDLLLIVGFFVCTAVLLTAVFSKRIVRSRQWYIFMGFGSWWAIQHQLLLGHQLTPGPPPHFLCLLQSSFIYAAPPANTFCLLCIFLQLFLLLLEALKNRPGLERMFSPFLIGVPFLAYFGVFLVALANGLGHPEQVARDEHGLTCHLTSSATMYLTAGLVTFACIAMIIIEVFTFTLLWKNYDRVQQLNFTTQGDQISLSIAIRTSIFSLLPILAVGVSIGMIVSRSSSTNSSEPPSAAPDLVMAVLPLSAGVIYGTQRDILAAWMFWKPSLSTLSPEKLPKGGV
ncbi:hypothetical protein DL96DRAFT_1715613 [Flagelloscypha sp. PMI_526]|nr:hypothetical protein DL96DRAFT_1715613 [Flagelloscypha sp. PMI_526]